MIIKSTVLPLGGDIWLSQRESNTVLLTKGWLLVYERVPGLHTCALTCDGVWGVGDLVQLTHSCRLSFMLGSNCYSLLHHHFLLSVKHWITAHFDLIPGGKWANVCLLHKRFNKCVRLEVDDSFSAYTTLPSSFLCCLQKTLGCRNSKNEWCSTAPPPPPPPRLSLLLT